MTTGNEYNKDQRFKTTSDYIAFLRTAKKRAIRKRNKAYKRIVELEEQLKQEKERLKKDHVNYLLDQLNKRKQFLHKIIKDSNNGTLDKQMAVSELDKIVEIEKELEMFLNE